MKRSFFDTAKRNENGELEPNRTFVRYTIGNVVIAECEMVQCLYCHEWVEIPRKTNAFVGTEYFWCGAMDCVSYIGTLMGYTPYQVISLEFKHPPFVRTLNPVL